MKLLGEVFLRERRAASSDADVPRTIPASASVLKSVAGSCRAMLCLKDAGSGRSKRSGKGRRQVPLRVFRDSGKRVRVRTVGLRNLASRVVERGEGRWRLVDDSSTGEPTLRPTRDSSRLSMGAMAFASGEPDGAARGSPRCRLAERGNDLQELSSRYTLR